jgi:ABC-type branched-subunit amino acid transport system permease subunit
LKSAWGGRIWWLFTLLGIDPYPSLVLIIPIGVLGGNGTILGPVIGAIFAPALFSFGNIYFARMHPIFSGLLIILVMKCMPGRLIGLKDRIFARR